MLLGFDFDDNTTSNNYVIVFELSWTGSDLQMPNEYMICNRGWALSTIRPNDLYSYRASIDLCNCGKFSSSLR